MKGASGPATLPAGHSILELEGHPHRGKGVRLLLCAPSGRAAKRMIEATGFEAKTIHRLLDVDPKTGGLKRGDDNPPDLTCWLSMRKDLNTLP
jgi:ATP-dependent exoDNAse (exonuclease V) alpha subunit